MALAHPNRIEALIIQDGVAHSAGLQSRAACSSIQLAIYCGISNYRLHVLPCFVERDRLDELSGLAVLAPGNPCLNVSFSRVVGCQCLLQFPAPFVEQHPQVGSTELDIGFGLQQESDSERPDAVDAGQLPPGRRNDLR